MNSRTTAPSARKHSGGSPVMLHLQVSDVDAIAARAIAAGAKTASPGGRSVLRRTLWAIYRSVRIHLDDRHATRKSSPAKKSSVASQLCSSRHRPLPTRTEDDRSGLCRCPTSAKASAPSRPICWFQVRRISSTSSKRLSALRKSSVFRVPARNLIMHAEVRIAGSMVELADATAEFKPRASTNILYVPDVDAAFQRAVDAGATSLAAPTDQPYGDRDGTVKDPGGNSWYITTHGSGQHIVAEHPCDRSDVPGPRMPKNMSNSWSKPSTLESYFSPRIRKAKSGISASASAIPS